MISTIASKVKINRKHIDNEGVSIIASDVMAVE
jgi:hypothetical protein